MVKNILHKLQDHLRGYLVRYKEWHKTVPYKCRLRLWRVYMMLSIPPLFLLVFENLFLKIVGLSYLYFAYNEHQELLEDIEICQKCPECYDIMNTPEKGKDEYND